MRARECRPARLARSFRRIVLSVLASPLAGAAACHPSPGPDETPVDATVPEPSSDAAGLDAKSADGGGGGPTDASLASANDGGGPDEDPDACGPVSIDGASIENVDGCASFQFLPCGLPATAQLEGCIVDLKTCEAPCTSGFFLYCQLAPI